MLEVPTSRSVKRKSFLLVLALLLLAAGLFAGPKPFTPTAGPPYNWSSVNNWTPVGVPGPGDDVTISSGTVTLDQPETVASLIISGSGSILQAAPGALTVTGNVLVNTTGTYSTAIPLTMNGAVLQQLTSNQPLGPLAIATAGTSVTLGSPVQIASLSQTAGTLDVNTAPSYQLTVAGNWSRTGGAFNPHAGTVIFSATASIQNPETFNNMTVNAPGSTVTLAFPNASTMTVSGSLTVASGTLSTSTLWDNVNNPPNPVITINGSLLLNGGTLDISQAPKPTSGTNPWTNIDIYGSLSGTAGGAINGGAAGPTGSFAAIRFRGVGLVDFTNIAYTPGNVRIWFAGNSTAISSTTFNPAGESIACIRIGSSTLQGGAALVLSGNLTLTGNDWTGSGAFSVAGGVVGTLALSSLVVNSGVTVTANSGLAGMTPNVTLVGLTPASFTSTGSTFVFNGTLSFTTNGGVFNNVQISAGTLTLADNLTLTGNWTNLGGTLTAGTSTVTFQPAGASATISGSTTFTNFTCATVGKTLVFANGTTQTVTGALTITGSLGNQIFLLSDSPGVQWGIKVGTAAAVQWAAVQDSNNSGTVSTIIDTTGGTNLGNDFGWSFPGATAISWVGGTDANWNVSSNWSIGRVPGVADNVTVNAATPSSPALTSNVSIGSLTVSTVALNLASFNLTTTGALTLNPTGTIQLAGGQTISTGSRILNGTVQYNGTGTYAGLPLGGTYAILQFTSSGTWTVNATPLSASSLSLSSGATVNLNGNNLVVTGNLTGAGTLAATGSEAINVGGSFTPGSLTAATSTVTLGGANTPVNLGGVIFYNLVINKAAQTDSVTSTGALTVTNLLTMTQGTWVASTFTHTIAGNWDSSHTTFTFTSGSSIVLLSPTANPLITTKGIVTDPFYNLTLSSGANLATSVQATNNLAVSSGALTLNGSSLTVGASLTGSALTATASETISVGGNWNIATFTPAVCTVTFTGTGAVQAATTFYNITVGSAGIVTLQASINISNTLALNGILNAGSFDITMNGNLWNNVGGTFNGGTGTVTFLTNAVLTINGNNNWYDFTCLVDGKTIQFQHLMTQTVLAGGNFNVRASSSLSAITLTSDSTSSTPNGSPPPALQGQWVITDQSSAVQTVDNVLVSWSYATLLITPGAGARDAGNNFGWNFTLPIVASWTLDTDNNGRIDRIRVQVLPTTQLNNDFSGFAAQVSGYRVIGYAKVGGPLLTPTNTDVFDILLQEGTREDTNATPSWQVTSNTTLSNGVGGALVEHNTAATTSLYVASGGARPVITYTLAAVNGNAAYVHFSEPVYGNDTASTPIASSSFSYSVAGSLTVQPVETSGNAAHAAIVTLPSVLGDTDLLQPGGQKITAATVANVGQIWSQVYPNWFDYPSAGSPAATHYPGDPGAYTYTNLDGNLPPSVILSPPGGPYSGRAMLTPSTTVSAPAHNVSDVGIGLVIPVLAEDQSITVDPSRGGVGMVTVFDGSKWLPPQNVFLEARIVPPALSGATLTLWWDITPPAAYDFNNLWIPPGATTLWNQNASGDRAHYPGDSQARSVPTSAANGALRDFIIQANDAAIKDGALFQFMFLLNDGTHVMPIAFPADPTNPSNVRPFEYMLHSLVQQRGGVTITNNVIRPDNGQTAFVHYTVTTPGPVTITVFNLSGDIVNVLQRGSQGSGDYSTAWDGKNRGGRIVARGIYFIRVVGPGFDEIRKVLVVR